MNSDNNFQKQVAETIQEITMQHRAAQEAGQISEETKNAVFKGLAVIKIGDYNNIEHYRLVGDTLFFKDEPIMKDMKFVADENGMQIFGTFVKPAEYVTVQHKFEVQE